MSNHTKGTWFSKDGQIYPETGKTLAVIPYYEKGDKEQEANAKLIAAAPELLKAVQVLRKHIEDTDNDLRYDGMIVPKADILRYCDTVICDAVTEITYNVPSFDLDYDLDYAMGVLYKISIRHAEDTTAEKEYTSAINKYKRKMKAGLPDHETECKRLYEEIGPSAVYDYGVKNKMPFSYCYRCEAETPTLNAHATEDNCAICGSPVNE